MHGWIHLIIAIILEVTGTTCMKMSHGFTKLVPSVLVVVFYGSAVFFLTMALKRVPVSIAYAVWSGLGTALIAIIGFMFFKESATFIKIMSIGLIIFGVIGLNING
jgi:small multidrug resistance pump